MRGRECIGLCKRMILSLILIVMVWVTGFPVAQTFAPVYAETVNEYDNTSVEEDLKELDLSLYPIDAAGSPAIASFVEYCYSENVFLRGNYGLYIYIYNPAQTEYLTREGANMMNIAVSYNASGEPSGYRKLPLKVCGTTTGKYERLFYKFRVMSAEEVLKNAAASSASNGFRRYDIASLQLHERGAGNAKSYTIGREYKCTGYAKGYGATGDAASTLKIEWKKAEVYEANVSYTNYRMESEYKDYTRHEVNTVYFSVPDKYITDYGNLQGIRAQWYEYKTSPIFVTEDAGAYAALSDYVGVNIGEKNEALKWRVLWDETFGGTGSANFYVFGKDYNRLSERDTWGGTTATMNGEYVPQISWLFSTGSKSYNDYQVSGAAIETWARGYSDKYGKDKNILGRYSEELFDESIDADRVQYLENPEAKRGKIIRDFDARDEFNMLSYNDTHGKWDKFFDYFGNWWNIPDEYGKTYRPISEVTAEALTQEKGAFCSDWLVNENDYDTFKSFCDTEIKAGNHPFVFRFARTDYYSSPARYDLVANFGETGYTLSDQDGYVAEQTVFLDFTMIHLKFVKDGTETIIPVAMDPIDIWNAVDPPLPDGDGGCKDTDWRNLVKKVLGIVMLVVLILIFWKPIAWLLDKIIALIGHFFKWLGSLFKKDKNKKENGDGQKETRRKK